MKKIFLRILLVSLIPCTTFNGFGQDPDTITVIHMTPVGTDSAQAGKKIPTNLRPMRPDNFWRRIQIGGNVGFQFGTVTGFNISPEVRIRAIDQLYIGTGFIYQYFRFNDYFYDLTDLDYISYTSNTFGGRIYARYYLRSLFDNWAGNFYAHVEYEYLHYVIPFELDPNGRYVDIFTLLKYSSGREIIDIHSIFVGGGYTQPVSNRVFIDFLILFNLNDSPHSPYTNPIFRLGVGVGL